MPKPLIGIVGAGNVGASAALLVARRELGDVILSDIVPDMPQGKALDLSQMCACEGWAVRVTGTNDVADMKACDVVVITAGIPRKPGMTREQLLDVNAKIVRDVCDKLLAVGGTPILIVVTNPLDVMTQLALKLTKWGRRRVVGMAGVLDSSRLAYFVSEKLGVSPRDVAAMVLGSHGDTMVALPRFTTASGIPITELLPREEVDKLVARARDGGAEIVRLLKQGSAYYAPAASVAAMVESILRDQNRVLPAAVYLEGEYGLKDVVVGVPAKFGRDGMTGVVEIKLNDDERKALHRSAEVVRENVKLLQL